MVVLNGSVPNGASSAGPPVLICTHLNAQVKLSLPVYILQSLILIPSHISQSNVKNRLYRMAAIALAGLAMAFAIVIYHDGNKLRGPLYLKETSFLKDVPMFRDLAPSVWSESHYPRPGKSDAGTSVTLSTAVCFIDPGAQGVSLRSAGLGLTSQEATVVARLRNDERLLEGIISEGKLVNQERSALKDGQSIKDAASDIHATSAGQVAILSVAW